MPSYATIVTRWRCCTKVNVNSEACFKCKLHCVQVLNKKSRLFERKNEEKRLNQNRNSLLDTNLMLSLIIDAGQQNRTSFSVAFSLVASSRYRFDSDQVNKTAKDLVEIWSYPPTHSNKILTNASKGSIASLCLSVSQLLLKHIGHQCLVLSFRDFQV